MPRGYPTPGLIGMYWQYSVLHIARGDGLDDLNVLGQAGWELVCVVGDRGRRTAYLRRPDTYKEESRSMAKGESDAEGLYWAQCPECAKRLSSKKSVRDAKKNAWLHHRYIHLGGLGSKHPFNPDDYTI